MGLDLSLNATGVAIIDNTGRLLYWTTVEPPDVLNTLGRIRMTCGYIETICKVFGVKVAAIEDYAYSLFGRGHSTSALVENAGAIKQVLISHDVDINVYSITAIKAFATDYGKASKGDMLTAFKQINSSRKGVTEHVVDATWVAMLHLSQVRDDQAA